jgi:hypothetical protein
MTEGMEQRHVTNDARILDKALGFTFVATPTEASDLRSPTSP